MHDVTVLARLVHTLLGQGSAHIPPTDPVANRNGTSRKIFFLLEQTDFLVVDVFVVNLAGVDGRVKRRRRLLLLLWLLQWRPVRRMGGGAHTTADSGPVRRASTAGRRGREAQKKCCTTIQSCAWNSLTTAFERPGGGGRQLSGIFVEHSDDCWISKCNKDYGLEEDSLCAADGDRLQFQRSRSLPPNVFDAPDSAKSRSRLAFRQSETGRCWMNDFDCPSFSSSSSSSSDWVSSTWMTTSCKTMAVVVAAGRATAAGL